MLSFLEKHNHIKKGGPLLGGKRFHRRQTLARSFLARGSRGFVRSPPRAKEFILGFSRNSLSLFYISWSSFSFTDDVLLSVLLSSVSARAREQREKADSNRCKLESKMYLECRMAKELMAEQPLATLGFREEDDKDENNNNNNDIDIDNKKNAREEENEKNGFVAGARRARQQHREMEESRRSRR